MIYEDPSVFSGKNLKKNKISQDPMGSCDTCPSTQKGTIHLLQKGDILTSYEQMKRLGASLRGMTLRRHFCL